MSWTVIARTDLLRARRSRLLGATVASYVLALIVLAVGLSWVDEGLTAAGAIAHTIALSEWLVPAVGFAIGYGAIVNERERRTIQHLVTGPHTRREVLIGKFVARSLLLGVAILVGSLVSAILIAASFGDFRPHLFGYLRMTGTTLLFGMAIVGLAVGISAMSRRPVRAATASLGAFIAFVFLWDLVAGGSYVLAYGRLPGSASPPGWYYFLIRLNPIEAYVSLLVNGFGFLDSAELDGGAWYLADGSMLLILLAWLVLPLSVGYHRFARSDLGCG